MKALMQELYLSSGDGDGVVPGPLAMALAASFGGADNWREHVALELEARRNTPGWLALVYSSQDGMLSNSWIDRDGQSNLTGVALLAIDAASLHCIDWAGAAPRYARAVEQASEGLGIAPDDVGLAMLIDVRRAAVFEQADSVIPGSHWRDPALAGQWMEELRGEHNVVLYCVHGHEVSRNAAIRLRAKGVNARFLEGGIDAWHRAGRPVSTK